MIPFIEKILVDYLGEQEAVTDIAEEIATKTPGELDQPWLRISLLADPRAGRSSADHLIAFYVQIDCYAGTAAGQSTASTLARTVRAAVGGMPRHQHDGAVVTSAVVNGSRPLRDDDLPQIDRYVVTATIHAHSIEVEGS